MIPKGKLNTSFHVLERRPAFLSLLPRLPPCPLAPFPPYHDCPLAPPTSTALLYPTGKSRCVLGPDFCTPLYLWVTPSSVVIVFKFSPQRNYSQAFSKPGDSCARGMGGSSRDWQLFPGPRSGQRRSTTVSSSDQVPQITGFLLLLKTRSLCSPPFPFCFLAALTLCRFFVRQCCGFLYRWRITYYAPPVETFHGGEATCCPSPRVFSQRGGGVQQGRGRGMVPT